MLMAGVVVLCSIAETRRVSALVLQCDVSQFGTRPRYLPAHPHLPIIDNMEFTSTLPTKIGELPTPQTLRDAPA
jgi:hypothetical protein